ncbi:MAG: hypothetical protein ABDI07_11870, partial [Candidatus Kryptonium sp.]
MNRFSIITKISLMIKQGEDGKSYYLSPWGSGFHGRVSFYTWYNFRVLDFQNQDKPVAKFPIQGKIEKGQKENVYIIRPDEERIVFPFITKCGFRGSSKILEINPSPEIVLRFEEYKSPRGNLGVSEGALIQVRRSDFPLKIKVKYTGRLYGDPPEMIYLLKLEDGE